MIGKRQIETLQKYARWITDATDAAEVRVKVLSWRRFTREAGGGAGYPVVMVYVYLDNGDQERADYLSTCKEHYAAIDKAKELARYLRDELKVDAAKIRVKDES